MQPQYTPSDVSRFWSKVNRTANPDECWEWIASCKPNGYGQIKWAGKAARYAHRVCYELECGPIPEGMEVCHRCDNPKCVNPAHLFLGSRRENVDDMISKGRMCIGESRVASKLTANVVLEMRGARRHGSTYRAIAARYCISYYVAWAAINRKTWRHVT